MLDVRTEERFPSDDHLDEDWMGLVSADPAATIFHSSRFLRRWCRHLRGRCDLRLRFVHRDGDLIGVIPEVREHEGDRAVAHFAGGYHVTDYLGPVSRPADRSDVVDAWFDALSSEDDWDELAAGGLAEDAGWHDLIAKRATDAGYDVSGPTREDVCPVVDVSGGWDGYLERLSSKQRHEIRRKARRLSREASTVKLVTIDHQELHDEVDRFVALARTDEGEKGGFFEDEAKAAFFHSLVAEFGPERRFRMHRLDIDGKVAAYTVSFVFGDRWGLYNSAFERSFGHLSPGMVLVGEVIRIAAEHGCGTFDLLRGDEPYKYRFGAVDRPLQRVEIAKAGS